MSKEQKITLIRIILTIIFTVFLIVFPFQPIPTLILFVIDYILIGYDIILEAFEGIKNKEPFDECLLMTIATIGAFALAIYSKSQDYIEAVAVMLFYQIGEWFQDYSVDKSKKNIKGLLDIIPEKAIIETDGQTKEVVPSDVKVGDIIIVAPGERVPIDGKVISGISHLDTSAITGESVPKGVNIDDDVFSGCINLDSVIKIKTNKPFEKSAASKILELIDDASSKKAHSEDFITKFARIYTPIVVVLALLLAIIPPIFSIILSQSPQWSVWIYRALTFLVISCPCALVISIPLSFFAGLGNASRHGILIKGSNYLEAIAKTKTAVFDKTGTLTKGLFEVTAVHPEEIDKEELLHLAAHVERYSTHPIAAALRQAFQHEADNCVIEDIKEDSGRGVSALVNGQRIYVGNSMLMDSIGIKWKDCDHCGTIIHVAKENEYLGHIVISDVVKENSKQTIKTLKDMNISSVMLTGDIKAVAESIASDLGIKTFYGELLPEGKVKEVEKLISKNKNRNVVFVGDGINDAPVLARADVGIAMGGLGSDAAIEAADIVLTDDDISKLPTAIKISQKCLRIVKENIWFAIGIKVLCLILGALGIANMWIAIFADVGVMVIAVLNAMRCLKIKRG